MNNDLPERPRSEEIDIVEIFNLIGRAIKSFFNFLLGILELIFKFFIILALFIKKNLVLLGLSALAGLIIGVVTDSFQKPYYTSTMIVEPNFGTSSQLINNIQLYNQLAKSNDSTELAQLFNISENEATKIIDITIAPISNANSRFKLYEKFTEDSDSIALKNMTYEEFEESIQLTDFELYYITLNTENKALFKKTEAKLVEIPLTNYVKDLKKTELAVLENQAKGFNMILQKIDSLRSDYKRIMLSEEERLSKPVSSGTTFYMGTENIRPTNELQLFDLEQRYINLLSEINMEQSKKKEFINVISGFQNIGVKMKKSDVKDYVLGALAMAVLFLLLIEFGKFLTQQEKILKKND